MQYMCKKLINRHNICILVYSIDIMNFFLEKVGETEKTEIGKTMIIDRMGTDPSTLLNLNNKFVSTVKIGWGLSLLCDEKFMISIL